MFGWIMWSTIKFYLYIGVSLQIYNLSHYTLVTWGKGYFLSLCLSNVCFTEGQNLKNYKL